MKIILKRDIVVALKNGRTPEMHKAGEVLSVYHNIGRRLLLGQSAKWIEREDGDPFWVPIPQLRAGVPQQDKMLRQATNK